MKSATLKPRDLYSGHTHDTDRHIQTPQIPIEAPASSITALLTEVVHSFSNLDVKVKNRKPATLYTEVTN